MEQIPYIGEILSVTAAISWAIGVIFFKRTMDMATPLAINLFKNVFAILLFIITLPFLNESFFPDVPLQTWYILLASGFIGIALADTLFFISLEKLGAGLTAIVDTSYTPIILIMSFVFLGESIGAVKLFGAGLIMISLLIGSASHPEKGRNKRDLLVGIIAGIAGIGLMAIGIVMIKHILNEASPIWITWVRILGGLIGLIPIIIFHNKKKQILAILKPSSIWKFIVPASFFGTYLAMTAWIGGMKYIEISKAALLNQLSTVFIFIFAIVFLKERFTMQRLAATVIALLGAACVIKDNSIEHILKKFMSF